MLYLNQFVLYWKRNASNVLIELVSGSRRGTACVVDVRAAGVFTQVTKKCMQYKKMYVNLHVATSCSYLTLSQSFLRTQTAESFHCYGKTNYSCRYSCQEFTKSSVGNKLGHVRRQFTHEEEWAACACLQCVQWLWGSFTQLEKISPLIIQTMNVKQNNLKLS